jgi:hypothetical protein
MTVEDKESEAIKPSVRTNQTSLIAARVFKKKANELEPKPRSTGGGL